MPDVLAVASLKEFFRGLLGEALGRHHLDVSEVAEFYLVNLLSDFAAADRLFGPGNEGEEPLALLYHRALQLEREGRIRMLRRLGDVSLYKAGFFASALRDGAVGPDYYIQMGGTAYAQLAALAGGGFGEVYRELGTKFRPLVEVLEAIGAQGAAASSPGGMLRVYETWTRNGGDALERVLVDAGMLPGRKGLPN